MIILIFLAVLFFGTIIKCAINDYTAAHANAPPIVDNQHIIDAITHLQAQKDGYTTIYYDLEKQLDTATHKQAIAIKKQLLALDNKIFTLDTKINKLLEKLD